MNRSSHERSGATGLDRVSRDATNACEPTPRRLRQAPRGRSPLPQCAEGRHHQPAHADVRMSRVGSAYRDEPGHPGERCRLDETLRILLNDSRRWESGSHREQQTERLEVQQGVTIVKRQWRRMALQIEAMEPRNLLSGLSPVPAVNHTPVAPGPHALVKLQRAHTQARSPAGRTPAAWGARRPLLM